MQAENSILAVHAARLCCDCEWSHFTVLRFSWLFNVWEKFKVNGCKCLHCARLYSFEIRRSFMKCKLWIVTRKHIIVLRLFSYSTQNLWQFMFMSFLDIRRSNNFINVSVTMLGLEMESRCPLQKEVERCRLDMRCESHLCFNRLQICFAHPKWQSTEQDFVDCYVIICAHC